MARMANIGASIEAEKIDIQTRQFFPSRPVKNPHTKSLVYGFRLGIHGSGVITQSYENPDEVVVYKSSMTSMGDEVHGASLDGWAKKPLGHPNVKKATGTHSGTFLSLSGGCYVHVEQSPREHLQSAAIQARHPEIEQVLRADVGVD